MTKFVALISLLLAVVISESLAVIVNKDVVRTVDASTSVVRVSTTVKASNVKGEYQIIFPNNLAANLAHLAVTSKSNSLKVSAPVMNKDFTQYTVEVAEENPTLKISSVFTSILEPFPAEITQRENQYMRLRENHYFYSPYETETQKSTFKLASTTIESFTKLSPFSTRGASVQYGPYENVPAFSISEAVIHYMNNFPFAKFSTMTREVEVSHWGNIAVEEIYELQHAGAKLAGGFSRIDYQMMRSGATPSFRAVTTTLPAQAHDVYYRDQIGNISTSEMRRDKEGNLELELLTRFPIFGGWKTQFYLGYSMPSENSLSTTGVDAAGNTQYHLKFDFFSSFDNVWVEDMELKVVLPEGCENVQVDVPYTVEQSRTRRFTYLDSELNGGRPVVILKAKNLVPEHDKQIHITYTFAQKRMLVEPLMLVSSFFVLFIVASLISRTGAGAGLARSLSSKSANNLAEESKTD